MPPWMPQPPQSPTPHRPRRSAALAAGALLAPLLLGGCGGSDQYAPQCPAMKLLADAADYSAYTPRGQDLTDLLLDGRITAAPAECHAGGKNEVLASMQVAFDMTRGPAAAGREAQVPYLVTVTEGERILDQKLLLMPVVFPPNVDRVTLLSDKIPLAFQVPPPKRASAYTIYVGFRLTPEQLALNRRRGAR